MHIGMNEWRERGEERGGERGRRRVRERGGTEDERHRQTDRDRER